MKRQAMKNEMFSEGDILNKIIVLLGKQRDRCLWYVREDFIPTNLVEAKLILDAIEKHGDMEAFIEARKVKEWLLQKSKVKS